MTDRRMATLDARVMAKNAVHAWANQVGPILLARFRPLVGQKLLKVDGSFLEKYKGLSDDIPLPDKMHRYWREGTGTGTSSLAYTLDICASVDGFDGCIYEKQVVYVGSFTGQVLSSVRDARLVSQTLRTNYTSAEVLRLRDEHKALQEKANKALSALYPFGESDR